ncbi:MAG: cytochrome P450 [Candidatus Dormibacteraeota bacterium]|nr:cytochrome P450 [Candidatus Dormibacteraeota bacterium]MBV9524801.1 cytochrome P450 [Candidatus Dormibacteraeota bacterium]
MTISIDTTAPPATSGQGGAGRDPLRVLAILARRKGDIFVYTTGQPQSFLVNRPEYVRHVLVDGADRYSKDTPINAGFATTIANALLTSEGATWRRQRSLMQPAFSKRNIPAVATIVGEQVGRLAARWDQAAAIGAPIDLHADTTQLMFRITSLALFHVDSEPWDAQMTDILGKALPVLTDVSQRPFRVAQIAIWDISQRIVEARKAQQNGHVDDVLGRLLQSGDINATHRALRDHVVTMALSGYETTASVITWGLYMLAQHPDVAEQLRSQIADVTGERTLALEDLRALPYLNAVVKETMRLYPPAWIIGRRALEDDRIGETDIPAGSVVAVSPYTLHRHPRYWPDPDRFDPRRFMDERAERDRPAFTYIPFGAGPRTCIGTNFAQVEAPLVLGQLLQRYRMRLVNDGEVQPQGIFVIVPQQPIHIALSAA